MTQIATQPNEQLEKIKSIAQRKFEAIQIEATELADRCTKLQIADENTLSIGTQLLASASDINKKVESKRKELKAPYIEAGKALDEVAARITDPLEQSIFTMKKKLKEWNDAQEVARQATQKQAEAKYTMLKQIEAQLDQKVKLAQSVEACETLANSILEKFPAPEKFENYAAEAVQVKKKFLDLLMTRRNMFKAAISNEDGAADKVSQAVAQVEAIEAEQAQISTEIEEKKQEIKENIVVTKSKTRKVWKFEVVDEAKLPKQFLSFDEKKAREYMSANKTGWGKEHIAGGVRFYEDEVPVA